MAIDTANGVTYYLSLPLEYKDYLGAIRHWENLKVGVEETHIWVKDLTPVQKDSVEVKSIPHKTLYYAVGPMVYLQGSLLPNRALPSLLWTPIDRGLPVQLPTGNHHYFGMSEKVDIRLTATDNEQEAFALLVTLEALQAYVLTAPTVRLKNIQWVLAGTKALLLGVPLLPIVGAVYWRYQNFLVPAGYQFEFAVLTQTVHSILNPHGKDWMVWQTDGRYWQVAKEDMQPLTIASFRQSTKF